MSGQVVLVVARADNGVIGVDGGLPWRLPADLRRFKTLTMGKPLIMGRKTFASLPGLLGGRRHIVLTRDREWEAPGAEIAHDAEAALWLAEDGGTDVCVIGGGEIYAIFLPFADRIEMTEVHAEYAGDTAMPALDPAHWRETAREVRPAELDRPAYDFVTLERAG